MLIHDKKSQATPPLSVAVSCKGLKPVLKDSLISLSRQDLDKSLWEPVFLFREGGPEERNSGCISLIQDYFPSPKLLFLQKGEALYEMRNLALKKLKSSYIYFIDEDVIFKDSSHLSRLLEAHKKRGEWTVIGAGYLNHPGCSFWGRSYNWIAELWMKNGRDLLPAGNLSIKNRKALKARFYSPNPFGFGGEEIFFLRSLQSEGYQILCQKELSVLHLALHNFKTFTQRAWIQGSGLACDGNKTARLEIFRFYRGKNTEKLKPKRHKTDYSLFFKEKAPFLIKFASLFYLLLVRLSALFYRLCKP